MINSPSSAALRLTENSSGLRPSRTSNAKTVPRVCDIRISRLEPMPPLTASTGELRLGAFLTRDERHKVYSNPIALQSSTDAIDISLHFQLVYRHHLKSLTKDVLQLTIQKRRKKSRSMKTVAFCTVGLQDLLQCRMVDEYVDLEEQKKGAVPIKYARIRVSLETFPYFAEEEKKKDQHPL